MLNVYGEIYLQNGKTVNLFDKPIGIDDNQFKIHMLYK